MSEPPDAVSACKAVLQHVVDVHCHPTDSPSTISPDSLHRLPITICPMATRQSDQPLVRNLALSHPDKVIPCFGYHPWFSHQIIAGLDSSNKEAHYRHLFLPDTPTNHENEELFKTLLTTLPEPRPLNDIIDELRSNLSAFPTAMLGEIGVDRSFRVPINYDASPRQLTPFTVPLSHQLIVVEAQIDLAIELSRNISFHSVKAQHATLELMQRMHKKHGERFNNISVDMHSCGFSPQTWLNVQKRYTNVFLSLSTTINARSPNHRELISVCDPNRLLVESDFHDIEGCASRTWEMVKIVAVVKGWSIESEWAEEELPEEGWGAVRKLERNFKLFQAGYHSTLGRASIARVPNKNA